jgi:6-phosphogluconolactonase (cycloisomerase 2 family)
MNGFTLAKTASAISCNWIMFASASFGGTEEDKFYVYVATTSGIDAFEFNANGTLTALAGVTTDSDHLSVHPTLPVVYSTNTAINEVAAYSISETGALALIGTYPGHGAANSTLISPDGNHVYIRDVMSVDLIRYDINADGSLTASSLHNISFTMKDIVFHPLGTKMYVVSDAPFLMSLDVNPTTGALVFSGFSLGPSIGRIYADESGSYARVLDNTNTISTYALDGSLDLVDGPSTVVSGGTVASLTQHESVYFAVNSSLDQLDRYGIQGDGSLSFVDTTFVPGQNPQFLTVHPEGSLAYLTNLDSDEVTAYTIDAAGNLGGLSNHATSASPKHIVIGKITVLESVPTVSEWGVIVMTLLVLAAGTLVFARRRVVAG